MTVRYVSIKSEDDIPQTLKNHVTFQVTDGNVEAVVVKVGGEFIRITKTDSYSPNLKVTKQAPKKVVKKFKLFGNFLGLTEITEVFEDKYSAEARFTEYQRKANWEETGLAIEEFEDFVDDTSI